MQSRKSRGRPSINSFEPLDAFIALSGRRVTLKEAQMLADARETFGDSTCRIGCVECRGACPHGVPIQGKLLPARQTLTLS